MSDDWQVVEEALRHATARGVDPQREKEALTAIARLRERVALLEHKNAEMLEKGAEWLRAIQRSIEQTERAEAEAARLRSES
jgi:3-hydroxyisobutyrate dehydrogenase-like beta-hydroxyacid dehydrogenase